VTNCFRNGRASARNAPTVVPEFQINTSSLRFTVTVSNSRFSDFLIKFAFPIRTLFVFALLELRMSAPLISTSRRLQYAQGYLALGMLKEAREELAAIEPADQTSDDVLESTIDLHSAAHDWKRAADAAEELTRRQPDDPKGWISWAFATRRLKSIGEAETILLEAEKRVGATCALVHYNLACYRCQLGDAQGAMQRLATACRMDSHWKSAALEDPDLAPLRSQIATLTSA
jgi:predicted Zn-dependent protease